MKLVSSLLHFFASWKILARLKIVSLGLGGGFSGISLSGHMLWPLLSVVRQYAQTRFGDIGVVVFLLNLCQSSESDVICFVCVRILS